VPVADSPKAIGAGFAETGCFFARTRRSWSILRCSCGLGRLGCVIEKLFHNPQGLPSCLISNARFGHGNLSVKRLRQPRIASAVELRLAVDNAKPIGSSEPAGR
jgi:hypothetical protein